jgi:hypothetical protein
MINKSIIRSRTISRPKPQILKEAINKNTYKAEQVLSAEAIYSVFFRGKPINLRTLSKIVDYPGPKYKKVSFSNPGHAHNLSERLNTRFDTDEFKVYRLTEGEIVKENDDGDTRQDS